MREGWAWITRIAQHSVLMSCNAAAAQSSFRSSVSWRLTKRGRDLALGQSIVWTSFGVGFTRPGRRCQSARSAHSTIDRKTESPNECSSSPGACKRYEAGAPASHREGEPAGAETRTPPQVWSCALAYVEKLGNVRRVLPLHGLHSDVHSVSHDAMRACRFSNHVSSGV